MSGAVAQIYSAGAPEGLRGWWPDAWIKVDWDKVPALAEDRAALWRSVAEADWLSPEEKRELVRP